MLLPVEEPIWQCTWCQQVCHVNCHNRHHTVLRPQKSKGKKKKGKQMGHHARSCTSIIDQGVLGATHKGQTAARNSMEANRLMRRSAGLNDDFTPTLSAEMDGGLSTVSEQILDSNAHSAQSVSATKPKKKRSMLSQRMSASGVERTGRLAFRRGTGE
eukprot:scaffold671561_cov78-Prasinocladus_malaysianus.AAC.1